MADRIIPPSRGLDCLFMQGPNPALHASFLQKASSQAHAARREAKEHLMTTRDKAFRNLLELYESRLDPQAIARAYQNRVSEVSGVTPKIRPMPRFFFERTYLLSKGLIDPNIPTLALPDNFGGVEEFLVSKTAQCNRYWHYPKGRNSDLNVVIPFDLNPASFTWIRNRENQEWNLYLKRGLLIDYNGVIYYGDFPKPVKLDMLWNTFSDDFFIQCRNRGIPLVNDIYATEISNDKTRSQRVLEAFSTSMDFNVPRSVQFNSQDLENLDNLEIKIKRFIVELPEKNGFVLKPSNLSQGIGVEMIPAPIDVKTISEKVIEAVKKYKTIILEPWIESFHIYNEGHRMDWNFRVIANSNNTFLIEARVHDWGKPVNKAQGAEILTFGEITGKLVEQGVDVNDVEDLRRRLFDIGSQLASKLNLNYLGVDIIIDKDLEPWILEINSGAVGGMSSLAERHLTVFHNYHGSPEANDFILSLEPKLRTVVNSQNVPEEAEIRTSVSPYALDRMLIAAFISEDSLSMKELKKEQRQLIHFLEIFHEDIEESLRFELSKDLLYSSMVVGDREASSFALKQLRTDDGFTYLAKCAQIILETGFDGIKGFIQTAQNGTNPETKVCELWAAACVLLNLVQIYRQINDTEILNKVFDISLDWLMKDDFQNSAEEISDSIKLEQLRIKKELAQLLFEWHPLDKIYQ